MKKSLLIIIFLQFNLSSYSQMSGPIEVCQYSYHCYERSGCSLNGIFYTCRVSVYNGELAPVFGTCTGATTQTRIRWFQPGAGYVHSWKKTLFGSVTYGHHYLHVVVMPCVVECKDHWILPERDPAIITGIWEASDYTIVGGAPGYLAIGGLTHVYSAENSVEIQGEFLAGYGVDFVFGTRPCLFDLRLSEPDSLNMNEEAQLDSALTFSCLQDSIPFGDSSLVMSSYFWDFGNGQTSTLPMPQMYYENPGTYYVSLTVVDSIGDTLTDGHNIYIEECDSISRIAQTIIQPIKYEVKIDKNNGVCYIITENDDLKYISLFDINGRVLYANQSTDRVINFLIDQYSPGIYLAKLVSKHGALTKKIFIN